MSTVADIRITDPVTRRIVEQYRREIGDSTPTKTAGRIIQAFHASGMKLAPEAPQAPEPQPAHAA